MGTFEIICIGIGLSMDAFAVSISNGMVYQGLTRKKALAMPVAFGLFQGLMPIAGFFLGNLFADIISRYAGIVTLIVLGLIGGNMIKESFSHDKSESAAVDLTYKTLLFQAVATSIDAFAVGVSFAAVGANIYSAAAVIAVTTFLCSMLAVVLGKKFGGLLGHRAELLGGVILVIIGVKAIF